MTDFPIIGLLGGSFNPIHQGHMQIIDYLLNTLSCQQVIVLPCANPIHKTPNVSFSHRLEMTHLACQDLPNVIIDTRESQETKPAHSILTLQSLRKDHPQASLIWSMGYDSFNSFDQWQDWQDFLSLCHLLVIKRGKLSLSPQLFNLWQNHWQREGSQLASHRSGHLVSATDITSQISSTSLRRAFHTGDSHLKQSLLPNRVADYIKQHQLYG